VQSGEIRRVCGGGNVRWENNGIRELLEGLAWLRVGYCCYGWDEVVMGGIKLL
jgi:hypothetical protein